jgi:ABC-2 type transport system ATP-binding protein
VPGDRKRLDAGAITIASLTKRYARLAAVDDVTISVASGEVYGLLGPNGSGKSTTIRVLLGYLSPTRGSVAVLGGDARDPSVRARIGYLPGDLRLPPRLTGRRILAYSVATLRAADRTVEDSQTERLAQRLDLDLDRPFATLSRGNRQKIGVVRALLGDPDVLVLDEPTSGLDPLVQDTVLELVRARSDAGAACLFSSHILSEVEAIADRVGVLNRGRLVTEGRVADLIASAPQHLILTTRDPVPHDVLADVAELLEVSMTDHEVRLSVAGSAAEVMTRLAPFGIDRVTSSGNELDEVFHRSIAPPPTGGAR